MQPATLYGVLKVVLTRVTLTFSHSTTRRSITTAGGALCCRQHHTHNTARRAHQPTWVFCGGREHTAHQHAKARVQEASREGQHIHTYTHTRNKVQLLELLELGRIDRPRLGHVVTSCWSGEKLNTTPTHKLRQAHECILAIVAHLKRQRPPTVPP